MQMPSNRWAKRILQWDVLLYNNGFVPKRSKGRPKMRWDDDLNAYAKYNGYETLVNYAENQNQNTWKNKFDEFANFSLV